MWSRLTPDIAGPTGEVQHVLDGAALLHRIQWPRCFPTLSRNMHAVLQQCVSIFWISHRRVRRLPQSVHQLHDTSTAHWR